MDAGSGANRLITFPASPYGDSGGYSVAFASDGLALVTADHASPDYTYLRRYDPAAYTSSATVAAVYPRTMLMASGDGRMVAAAEQGDQSLGRLLRFDVAAQTFTASPIQFVLSRGVYPGANHDGTQFSHSLDLGTVVVDTNLDQIYLLGAYLAPRPVGVAYHPALDLLFAAWGGSSQVIAYDSTSFAEVARFDFGVSFGTGASASARTRVSRDGALVMVNTDGAISLLRWTNAPPQIAAQPAGVSISPGSTTSFSVQAIGLPPFDYQWRFNGADLDGATNATLALTNVQAFQCGNL